MHSDVLILLAHGSQHAPANHEVADLATSLSHKSTSHIVTHAFLGVVPPTLPETLEHVVSSGATHVDVLPLFLNSGNHITKDIPALIEELRRIHPNITLRQLRHIGASKQFHALVKSLADNPTLREEHG